MLGCVNTLWYIYIGKMLYLVTTDFRGKDGPVKVTEGHKCELSEVEKEATIAFDFWDRSVFNLWGIFFGARQSLGISLKHCQWVIVILWVLIPLWILLRNEPTF